MEPIKINLATIEYFDKRYVHATIVGTAVFFLIISSYTIFSFINNKTEIDDYNKKIERLENTLTEKQRTLNEKKKDINRKKIDTVNNRTLFVNRLIARDIFPWNQLLYMFEIRLPEGMFLKNFSPSENFSKLTIKGHADSTGEVSLFLKRLNDWDLLQNNILTSLSLKKKNSKKDTTGIQFTIESTLRIDRFFSTNGYSDLGKILAE